MSPKTTGDVALAARVATAETFQGFGQLLAPGGQVRLARRGQALLAVQQVRRGPRRVTHLIRYPEAKRLVMGLGSTELWMLVLGAGEPPAGPPAAFQIPAGTGVVLAPGVWHAGPIGLGEGTLLEGLEARGPADHMDRRSVRELVGPEAFRVSLPQEPGAPEPGLDLKAPGAVLLDASLHGVLRLACLAMDGLEVSERDPELVEELEEAFRGVRAMFGRVTGVADVPGIDAVRRLFSSLEMDPHHVVPSSEALVAMALAGKAPPTENALVDALRLASLRTRVPVSAFDAERITDPVMVRRGRRGEGFTARGRGRIAVDGRPVLLDRDGPFGSPAGDGLRARPSTHTRRALVVLYLPAEQPLAEVGDHLDRVGGLIQRYCGGQESERLIVG